MVKKMNQADIYAMFERVGVDPLQRDRRELHEQPNQQYDQYGERKVVYRTVLTDGTGRSMRGSMDAELESNAR